MAKAKADANIDYAKYTVTTPVFRASFVDLNGEPVVDGDTKQPVLNKDGSPLLKYKMAALFPKGENLDQFKMLGGKLMTEMFGADQNLWPNGFLKPWGQQADKSPQNPNAQKQYEGWEVGALFMNLSSYRPITIFDQQKNEVFDKKLVYSGLWLRGNVTLRWFDNKSKGIKAQVNAIQIIKNDKVLGTGGPSAEQLASSFEPVEMDTSQGAGAVFGAAGGSALD